MIEYLTKLNKKYIYNGVIIIPTKINFIRKQVEFRFGENEDLTYLINLEIEKEIEGITKSYLWNKNALNKMIGMWKDYPQSFILQENDLYNNVYLIENVKWVSCAIDTFISDFNTMFPAPYSLNNNEFIYLTHRDRKSKNNLSDDYYELQDYFYYSLQDYIKILEHIESKYKKEIEYANDIENFKSYEEDLFSDGLFLSFDEIEKDVKELI